MITRIIFGFIALAILFPQLQGQSRIETSDCLTIDAFYEGNYNTDLNYYEYILEKEIARGIWKKSLVKTTKQQTTYFEVHAKGNYRVNIIPIIGKNRTSIETTFHYNNQDIKNTISKIDANVYISNELQLGKNNKLCLEGNAAPKTKLYPSNTIQIYPNPTHSILTIDSDKNLVEKVFIYSLEGKEVAVFQNITSNNLDVSRLAEGLYVIQILIGEELFTKKVAITRK